MPMIHIPQKFCYVQYGNSYIFLDTSMSFLNGGWYTTFPLFFKYRL